MSESEPSLGLLAPARVHGATRSARAARLSRLALLGDLLNVFRRGPAAIVAGDVRDQLRRVRAETKRRLGLRLTRADLADVRAALHGIDASRKYVLGYEYIYSHLKARVSPTVAARLGEDPIYPLTMDVIALGKSFGLHQLPRIVAFLDAVSRDERREDGCDLTAAWDRARAEDDEAAYAHFTRCAWRLIYTVALRRPSTYLPAAIASIPRVEPYIRETAGSGLGYYDVLAGAPKHLRAVAYAADANRKGHALDGAHIPFPPEASENASRVLDGYLEAVLGPEAARRHVLFSATRHRIEDEDPLDVQALMERAQQEVDATPKEDRT